MSRMFQIDGKTVKTWPVLRGKCPQGCVYCWVQDMCNNPRMPNMRKKYSGPIEIDWKVLKQTSQFKRNDIVFVAETNDLFAEKVNDGIITDVLEASTQIKSTLMFCTKNPERYLTFPIRRYISSKDILCATIETDCEQFHMQGKDNYKWISRAPRPYDRLTSMQELDHPRKAISIEPILPFSPDFAREIIKCNPKAGVWVGYDSKDHKLPEPSLEDTKGLIKELREAGINVIEKEKGIRKAWWES